MEDNTLKRKADDAADSAPPTAAAAAPAAIPAAVVAPAAADATSATAAAPGGAKKVSVSTHACGYVVCSGVDGCTNSLAAVLAASTAGRPHSASDYTTGNQAMMLLIISGFTWALFTCFILAH